MLQAKPDINPASATHVFPDMVTEIYTFAYISRLPIPIIKAIESPDPGMVANGYLCCNDQIKCGNSARRYKALLILIFLTGLS